MVANIETVQGQSFFVAGRSTPGWHKLGKTVDGLMTLDEVLSHSNLKGWNVRKQPLEHVLPNGDTVTLPGKHVAVRDNPITGETEAISVVGDSYKVFQNEDAFRFAQDIVDMGAAWDTAGSLGRGERVFGTLITDREFVLDPDGANDKVVTYLVVGTSHDGSLALTYVITPIRVVCQNTLSMALGGAKATYSVRHTSKADLRLIEARKALDVTFDFMDGFEAEAKRLYEVESTKQKFDDIIKTIWDKPEPEYGTAKDGSPKVKNQNGITRWENRRDLLHDIYLGTGDVIDTNANIRGTAWGMFNALAEYDDWYRGTRGDNSNLYKSHLGLHSNDSRFKSKALSVVRELTAA